MSEEQIPLEAIEEVPAETGLSKRKMKKLQAKKSKEQEDTTPVMAFDTEQDKSEIVEAASVDDEDMEVDLYAPKRRFNKKRKVRINLSVTREFANDLNTLKYNSGYHSNTTTFILNKMNDLLNKEFEKAGISRTSVML